MCHCSMCRDGDIGRRCRRDPCARPVFLALGTSYDRAVRTIPRMGELAVRRRGMRGGGKRPYNLEIEARTLKRGIARCVEGEFVLGRAACNRPGERAPLARGFDARPETVPLRRYQGHSAAFPGTDRASPTPGHDLSARGKATGRSQGSCGLRQDLAGRDLVATT